MRRATIRFDGSLVRIADVVCAAPRSGCGEEEAGGAWEVVVPRRGVFAVHRGGEALVADPNTAVVLRGGEPYRVSHPVDGGDACTVLVLGPELAEEALGPARSAPLDARAQLGAWRLAAGPAEGRADPLAAEESALVVLAALAAAPRPALRPAGRRRVEDVRALLAGRPTAPWRLDEIARAVSCSPFHLARLFRAATGETLFGYLLRLRLALALQRLADGEDDLARLAVELGFSHHSHFSARFRAIFATTPSHVRKSLTAGSPVPA